MNEEITLHLKIRVPVDSPDSKLLSFLKDSRTSATQMVLEAVRAYWLPVACASNKHPERIKAIAHECLRTLQIQERYISTICELESSLASVPVHFDVSRSNQEYQIAALAKSENVPFSSQEPHSC
ncbi:MAG: hypothetical protein KME31_12415 [Tolypothrix carrinoi HA7290-LM1]|jgi:hypothetical protein|nr:hypothetical protein [Tolypothrix carrinoi HA7290-LM1]